ESSWRASSWQSIKLIALARSLVVPKSLDPTKCLYSLAFPQIDSRYHDISNAVEGSYGWLLRNQAYSSWAGSHRSLLWIKGKPGSGKSTLLKYALASRTDLPSAKANDVVLSFFFHGRGDELQRTPLGMVRSLLHQIMTQYPDVLSDMVE